MYFLGGFNTNSSKVYVFSRFSALKVQIVCLKFFYTFCYLVILEYADTAFHRACAAIVILICRKLNFFPLKNNKIGFNSVAPKVFHVGPFVVQLFRKLLRDAAIFLILILKAKCISKFIYFIYKQFEADICFPIKSLHELVGIQP